MKRTIIEWSVSFTGRTSVSRAIGTHARHIDFYRPRILDDSKSTRHYFSESRVDPHNSQTPTQISRHRTSRALTGLSVWRSTSPAQPICAKCFENFVFTLKQKRDALVWPDRKIEHTQIATLNSKFYKQTEKSKTTPKLSTRFRLKIYARWRPKSGSCSTFSSRGPVKSQNK